MEADPMLIVAQHGHTVLNPKLPDDDFDGAVRIAQAEFDRHRPDVVVSSSREWATHLRDGAVADYTSFNQRMAASRQS